MMEKVKKFIRKNSGLILVSVATAAAVSAAKDRSQAREENNYPTKTVY